MPNQGDTNLLTTDERNRLAYEIVASLSDFTEGDIRGRRGLMVSAGLEKFLAGITWTGSDHAVAGNVVDKLNNHGFLKEKGSYHALGALIAALLKHSEPSEPNKQFMAGLVVRYDLIRDPSYIEELRKEYDITDEPSRHSEPLPPPSEARLSAQVRQPEFVPVVQDLSGLEAARNSETNLLDIIQLLGALYSAEAVGRVELEFKPLGTGWLIGPDMLLTNQHVLPDKDTVAVAKVRFGYRLDKLGVKAADGHVFSLNPDDYYPSPVDQLDYALVRLTEAPLAHMVDASSQGLSWFDLIRQQKHRGYLLYTTRKIRNQERVNMIQHPGGSPQKVALTQNFVTADMSDTRVQYTTDTLEGSSGSPVFTPLWEVIALHHSERPVPPIPGLPDMNEGIPMKAIIKDFENRRTRDDRPLINLLPRVQ